MINADGVVSTSVKDVDVCNQSIVGVRALLGTLQVVGSKAFPTF